MLEMGVGEGRRFCGRGWGGLGLWGGVEVGGGVLGKEFGGWLDKEEERFGTEFCERSWGRRRVDGVERDWG